MPRKDDQFPSHPNRPFAFTSERLGEAEVKESLGQKQVDGENLNDGAVGVPAFGTGLRPIQIVAALPGLPDSNYPQGAVVFLTSDNKLYRSTGAAWTLAVATVDLTGTITTAQITDGAVTTIKIGDAQVTTQKINDLAVSTAKIGDAQVTTTKIGDSQVTTIKIGDLQITSNKLNDLAVTTAKLNDLAVSTGKIAALAVDSTKLADLAVTTAKIAALAVDTAKIAANAVTAAKVAAGQLDLSKLTAVLNAALSFGDARNQLYNPGFEGGATYWTVRSGLGGTINTNSANANTGNKYLEITSDAGEASLWQADDAGAVRYFEVNPGDVVKWGCYANRLAGGTGNGLFYIQTFDKDKNHVAYTAAGNAPAGYGLISNEATIAAGTKYVAVFAFVAPGSSTCRFDDCFFFRETPGGDIVARTIAADRIIAGAITANEIAALTITAAQVAAATITGAKIAANTITAANIQALTITAAEIAAGTITGAKIAATTITAANIAALTITAAEIAASTITGAKIAATTITAAHIAASTLTVDRLTAGFRNFLLGANPLNALKNPGIEDGITYWQQADATVTAVTDSSKAHTGNKYLQLQNAGAASWTTLYAAADESNNPAYVEVAAGDVVSFGGWGYKESGDAGAYFGIEVTDKDKGSPSYFAVNITGAAWSQFTASHTIASGEKYVRFFAQINTAGTVQTTVRVDDMFLTLMIPGASIVAASITASQIAADTITASQIAAGAIGASELAAGSVVAGKIAALTIVAADIAAATITGAKIAATTITAANIAALTITANEIAAGAVTAAKISVSQLDAISANLGTITAGLLRDTNSKFIADLANALLTITDNQGSPVIRVKVGKVGAGTSDYGIQVYDPAGATIMDFTGAKRILAVPVQPSANSGTAITVDLSTGLTQQILLTGTAVVTLSNPVDGGRYRIWFQQDATGSRPFPTIKGSVEGEVVMYTNDTAPTLTTTPGALDLFEFEYRTNPTKRFTCMTLQTNVLLPTPTFQTLTETGINVAATTHNIAMPATVNAGDLLVCLISVNTGNITTPSGWTFINNIAQAAVVLAVYTKVAAGTEGGTNVNFVTDVNAQAAAQVYRFTRASGATLTSANGSSSANPDPPLHSPGTDRKMWLAVAAEANQPTISVYPTNYLNGSNKLSGAASGVSIGSARRAGLYAASDNPSTFTFSSANAWCAMTISIQPPL